MTEAKGRLPKYLEEELGECTSKDVECRIEELRSLRSSAQMSCFEEELDVFSALANRTRYAVVRTLVAANGELCVCELNSVVDVSESGLSHALSKLVEADLVEGRQDGQWKKYRATNRAVAVVTVVDGVAGENLNDPCENHPGNVTAD
ncbi:MAG: ArsR/SmtB family transcription factor [Halobacteria archaeon]